MVRTVLLVTDGPTRKGLAERVARANALSPDLFLSIHHDSVPDSFLQRWQYEGTDHYFSDRFKGHSIFISNDNADVDGSFLFGQLMGEQLKARDLQYTAHYIEKFMGHRQRLLVDARTGVYRYDQLIVLKNTQMPAVLLEAGSIINRDEELLMSSPERQSAISAAVIDAVESFCAVRKPAPAGSCPCRHRCQAGPFARRVHPVGDFRQTPVSRESLNWRQRAARRRARRRSLQSGTGFPNRTYAKSISPERITIEFDPMRS